MRIKLLMDRRPPDYRPPKISLIFCAPRSPEKIARTIGALKMQAFHDFEGIVINRFRADALNLEITKAIDHDPRFRLVQFRGAASTGAMRNAGLRLTRSNCLAFIQEDCCLADLEQRISQLEAFSRSGLHEMGERFGSTELRPSNHITRSRLDEVLLQTQIARAIGGFNEADNVDEEADFLKRLSEAGGIFPHRSAADRCHGTLKRDLPVLFVPHKDYHVWTIGLLAPKLRALGIDFLTLDLTPQWGEAGIRSSADRHGVKLLGLGEFMLTRCSPRLMVTFNDWDYISRPLMLAARAAGVATLGIVEGIQDYNDADTATDRKAYRLVENVILPGVFDYRYFANADGQRVFIAGVPRIQVMRDQPERPLPTALQKRVLINSNFSYGVLEQHRDGWVTAAVRAVRTAGYEPVISRHPADKGSLFPDLISKGDFYETLHTCSASIQRFASGVLEAIAYNKPVFYFNIHGEKADKFTFDPMGTYPVSHSEMELISDLRALAIWQHKVRERGPAFLDIHAGKRTLDIAEKTAQIIAGLSTEPVSEGIARTFHAYLHTIDHLTDALCAPDQGRHAPFFELDGAIERLKASSRKLQGEDDMGVP